MKWGCLLIVSLCHNEVSGLVVLNKHGHDADKSTAEVGTQAQKSILSSSVQDYLSQIEQMEFTSEPPVAIPGEWLTDAKKSFVFLPIKIPKNMPLDDVKMLTDGKSLLVNVVERPLPRPEDESTKKFRLVLDAFKDETKGNEVALIGKLQEWLADEDSTQVQGLIRETIASINMEEPRKPHSPRSLTIPLNELELGDLRHEIAESHMQKKAVKKDTDLLRVSNAHGGTATIRLRSTYLQQDATTRDASQPGDDSSFGGSSEPNLITIPLNAQLLQELVKRADYVVPLDSVDQDAFADLKGSSLANDGGQQKTYIKESFSISLPYASEVSRVFAVLQGKGQVIVCIPFEKDTPRSLTVPFSRVPLFDMDGKKLLGPGASAEVTPEIASAEKVEKTPKAAVVAAVKRGGVQAPKAAAALSASKKKQPPPAKPAKKRASASQSKPASPPVHTFHKAPPVPPAPPSPPARKLISVGDF